MIDLLTIMQGRYNKTLLGNYYPTQTDTAIPFDYEIIDSKGKDYRTVSNLTVNEYGYTTVKTNDPLEWKIGGFVTLQTGGLYLIEQIREDQGSVSKQAYRNVALALGVEYVLRLTEVDNPRGLR
jgi:hypothetical protein